jgi:hypothetical protein
MHGGWNADEATARYIQEAPQRQAWGLCTRDLLVPGTEQPLAPLLDPSAQPVKGTITAPWVLC